MANVTFESITDGFPLPHGEGGLIPESYEWDCSEEVGVNGSSTFCLDVFEDSEARCEDEASFDATDFGPMSEDCDSIEQLIGALISEGSGSGGSSSKKDRKKWPGIVGGCIAGYLVLVVFLMWRQVSNYVAVGLYSLSLCDLCCLPMFDSADPIPPIQTRFAPQNESMAIDKRNKEAKEKRDATKSMAVGSMKAKETEEP